MSNRTVTRTQVVAEFDTATLAPWADSDKFALWLEATNPDGRAQLSTQGELHASWYHAPVPGPYCTTVFETPGAREARYEDERTAAEYFAARGKPAPPIGSEHPVAEGTFRGVKGTWTLLVAPDGDRSLAPYRAA